MNVFNIERGSKSQSMVNIPDYDGFLPVTVVRGRYDGPNVLISAGIHNQEYVGIEAANRLAAELDPSEIKGCVCIIHVCNPIGFFSFSPDIVPEDGKNLNRVFPGKKFGSASERLADFLTEEFLSGASCFLDLHCGGCREELAPHVYYQGMGDRFLENASKRMAKLVEADYMVRADIDTGSLFSHAAKMGIPGVLIERGGMALWSEEAVEKYLTDVKRILRVLDVLPYDVPQEKTPLLIEHVDFFCAQEDGCWYPAASAGTIIEKGKPLGSIRDFFGKELSCPIAKTDCVILYQVGSLAVIRDDFLVVCGVL